MPPKKSGKKGQEADAPALPLTVVRPSTPNDFRIVATVRALQELVNTETKWKNRLIVASRDETVVRAKIARVHQLVALCEKGIAQCLANVEGLVEEQFNMVSSEPSQVAAWQHGAHALLPGGNLSCAPPQSAANGGGAAGKTAADAKSTQGAAGNAKPAAGLASGKGAAAALAAAASRPSDASMFPPGYRPENEASLAGVPPGFWEQRQKQKELLRTMLLALYQTPRLTRERQVQRPSSPVEMQHELEEATRLATPIAELMAMQNSKLVAKTPKAVGGGGAAASKAAKNAKGGAAGDKNVVLDDTTSIAESEVMHLLSGDLSSYDCLVLPTPRGLDAKLLHRVQMQRSRRLRLEASIALFKAELPGLESRLRCIADMSSVGQYSLSAVAPAVVRTIEEEVALQRVRVQEDESFQLRRAATPSGAGAGSSGVLSRRPVSTPPTA